MTESYKEERGYPEICTYTVKSDDEYEDYQQGSSMNCFINILVKILFFVFS